MPKRKRSERQLQQTGGSAGTDSKIDGSWKRVLAWIGGATAILTLVFGLQRLVSGIGDWRERNKRTAELIAVSNAQRESQHYPDAWASLKDAEQLDATNEEIYTAQEDLAMEWLRNARVRQGEQTFTQLVAPLQRVIDRGILRAQGPRKADLLAHAGWADFLRWRDGARELAVEERYRRAVAIDASNPFAHTMWGYWSLFTGDDLDAARRHFAQAFSSQRELDYVRSMQLAALLNRSNDENVDELMRVANEMRRQRETIEKAAANSLLWRTCYSNRASALSWRRSRAGIPPGDEIETLRWLLAGSNRDQYHSDLIQMCEARAHAWAGDTARALRMLRALAANAEGDATRWEAQQAVTRLTEPRTKP